MIDFVISPSKLEEFRKYIHGEFDEKLSIDDVITYIKGEKEWNRQMLFGAAFHEVIEHGSEKFYDPERGIYSVKRGDREGEIILHQKEIEVAESFREQYPFMVFEIKLTYPIQVGSWIVLINSRIDALNGTEVHENKTSSHLAKDYTDYFTRSCQWKLYAIGTKCTRVQYNFFPYRTETKSRPYKLITPSNLILYPYPKMLEDMRSLLGRFIEFCFDHSLVEFIRGKDYEDKKFFG